jgi:hypothetical protein
MFPGQNKGVLGLKSGNNIQSANRNFQQNSASNKGFNTANSNNSVRNFTGNTNQRFSNNQSSQGFSHNDRQINNYSNNSPNAGFNNNQRNQRFHQNQNKKGFINDDRSNQSFNNNQQSQRFDNNNRQRGGFISGGANQNFNLTKQGFDSRNSGMLGAAASSSKNFGGFLNSPNNSMSSQSSNFSRMNQNNLSSNVNPNRLFSRMNPGPERDNNAILGLQMGFGNKQNMHQTDSMMVTNNNYGFFGGSGSNNNTPIGFGLSKMANNNKTNGILGMNSNNQISGSQGFLPNSNQQRSNKLFGSKNQNNTNFAHQRNQLLGDMSNNFKSQDRIPMGFQSGGGGVINLLRQKNLKNQYDNAQTVGEFMNEQSMMIEEDSSSLQLQEVPCDDLPTLNDATLMEKYFLEETEFAWANWQQGMDIFAKYEKFPEAPPPTI